MEIPSPPRLARPHPRRPLGVAGGLAFLRIAQGTLRDAETTIGELHAWEFRGPFLSDFTGARYPGKRDAGAFQYSPAEK